MAYALERREERGKREESERERARKRREERARSDLLSLFLFLFPSFFPHSFFKRADARIDADAPTRYICVS